jgi:hypothetical protein
MKYYIAALFTIVIIYFTGCSGITVDKKINVSPDDWVMSGRSPQQQHVSKYVQRR